MVVCTKCGRGRTAGYSSMEEKTRRRKSKLFPKHSRNVEGVI
jgi:hypothetical protein